MPVEVKNCDRKKCPMKEVASSCSGVFEVVAIMGMVMGCPVCKKATIPQVVGEVLVLDMNPDAFLESSRGEKEAFLN